MVPSTHHRHPFVIGCINTEMGLMVFNPNRKPLASCL